jgi:Right handed beta helix region
MRKKLPLFSMLVVVGLLMSPRAAAAATYYVDNSGSPACSNSPANGSQAAPWCTVQYGVSRISGGDTLYVKNGTYNEAFSIKSAAGTAAAHTVISAYPGHAPVLRGSGLTGGRMKIAATSHIDFRGFTITNNNQGLYVDDDAGTDASAHDIAVTDVTVHDVGQEGIAIRGNVSNITLNRVTVYNTGRLGTSSNGEGIYIGGGSATDNTHAVTVQNSTIHDTQDEGIELKHDTHDCVIEGNTLYNIMSGSAFSNGGGAIEIDEPTTYPSNPNHLIRNNVIRDMVFNASWTKRGIRIGTGATVYNNVLYNIASQYTAILSNSASPGNWPRLFYHNTVDASSSTAVVNSGTNLDSRNNIGPSTTNNSAISSAFFFNYAGHDYRLVAGAAVVNVGVDLRSTVPLDVTGVTRDASPDRGAYEYQVSVSAPAPPTNVRIIR